MEIGKRFGNLEKIGNLEKKLRIWKEMQIWEENWKFREKFEIWQKKPWKFEKKLERVPNICNLLSGKDDFCCDGDIFVICNKFQFATKLCHELI